MTLLGLEPAPGTVIGPYRVRAPLGRGGMASVLEVEHTGSGEIRALKLLLPTANKPELLIRFEAEHQTLADLNHPHIVCVYDRGTWQDRPWFAMERLFGEDLRAALTEWGDIAPAERFRRAEQILIQVADALAYVHDRGLVHRDITPGNIMLSPDGVAKLMDFGVVKAPGMDLTVVGEMIGTVAYIAPEQITSDEVDARADLYSLGTVLYLMLTQRRPFNASTLPGYLEKHLNLKPRPPRELSPTVPHHLDEICMRLLEKEPVNRYGSAHHLLALLGRRAAGVEALDPANWPPRLVGRNRELAHIRQHVASLAAGRGGVVLIEAPAGFGKTRLLGALADWAAEMGIPVDSGVCGRRTGGAFREVLRTLAPDPDAMPDVLKPGEHRGAPVEGIAVYSAFRDLLVDALPRVVILHEVHAAGRGTLELLSHLLHNLRARRDAPVLFALARCPVGSSDPLRAPLDSLPPERAPERLTLPPVSVAAVEELLLQLIPDGRRTRMLARRLHREGEGNPHFIGEMIRGLVEEGVILADGPDFALELTDVSRVRLPIPGSIREALAERLQGLSAGARRTAALAALCQHELTFDVMLEALMLTESALMDSLEELLDAGILRQREVGGEELFELAQNRLAEVLSEVLSTDVRVGLHAQVGMAMERIYRHRLASVVEAVAYHFEQGELPGKAFPYLVRAGERLMARSFMPEAMDYFERAHNMETIIRELLPLDEADRRVAALQLDRGEALEHMGRWPEALEALETAERLSSESRALRLRSRVLARLGTLNQRLTRAEEAETYLTEALSLADQLGDTQLRLQPLYILGSARWARGDLEGARNFWLDTLAAAGAVKDEQSLARAYRGLGVAAFCRGNTAEARKFLEQSCQKFEALGMFGPLAITRVNLVELCHCTGNLRKGLGIAEKTVAQAREVQHRQGIALGMLYRSLILVDLLRLEEAESSAREAREELILLEARDDEVTGHAFLARVGWALGDQALVAEQLDQVEAMLEESVDTEGYAPLFAAWRALWLAREGRMDAAREMLARAGLGVKTWSYQVVRLDLVRARVLGALGENEPAIASAQKALEVADRCGYRLYSLKAHRLLASLGADVARHERIAASLARSLSANLSRVDGARFRDAHIPTPT